jgi:hypothetical protein
MYQIQVVFRELAYYGIDPAIYSLLMFFTGGVGIDYGFGKASDRD